MLCICMNCFPTNIALADVFQTNINNVMFPEQNHESVLKTKNESKIRMNGDRESSVDYLHSKASLKHETGNVIIWKHDR